MADDLSISFYKLPSSRRQVRRVKQIIPHSRFHPLRISNDIAVIYVCTQLKFNITKIYSHFQLIEFCFFLATS